MIDYSRTFWRKDITENILDALSYYKMNKLHMHLTDDQGWRLEIDKYPALTEIGSRFDTIYNEPEEKQGYYSKDDIDEIVRYAAARNVEIIPEIEMPGHALAVLAAFPELSCTGETPKIHPFSTGPYIHEEILCAGKEETYEFLESVLDEVAGLFPSQYIHIGGDEAPKAEWKKCPDCQRAIKENGLKDEHELQSWFIKRVENYLNSKGKKLIGWDEITEGGLSKTATMMFWRGWMEDALLTAVNQGNDVIMSPTTHCYFDYTYETTSVEKVYSYEPLSDKLEDINPEHILGVQANFWSHIDRDVPKMHRQIFPRILALAEVGWTERGKRNWDNFSSRLKHHYKTLELLDLYYMAQE
jgi:hexosaminidase